MFTSLPRQYILGALSLLQRCRQAPAVHHRREVLWHTKRRDSTPTRTHPAQKKKNCKETKFRFFSWGRLRIEERRLSSSKFHWEEKYLFFPLAETMQTSKIKLISTRLRGSVRFLRRQTGLGHTKGAFWRSPDPQGDPRQLWGHARHTGCKSLTEPSARAWEEQNQKKQSPLTHQSAYSSGADFYKAFNSSKTK